MSLKNSFSLLFWTKKKKKQSSLIISKYKNDLLILWVLITIIKSKWQCDVWNPNHGTVSSHFRRADARRQAAWLQMGMGAVNNSWITPSRMKTNHCVRPRYDSWALLCVFLTFLNTTMEEKPINPQWAGRKKNHICLKLISLLAFGIFSFCIGSLRNSVTLIIVYWIVSLYAFLFFFGNSVKCSLMKQQQSGDGEYQMTGCNHCETQLHNSGSTFNVTPGGC